MFLGNYSFMALKGLVSATTLTLIALQPVQLLSASRMS